MAILRFRDEEGNVVDIPTLVGPPGADYVLTEADKAEIAAQAAELVESGECVKTVNGVEPDENGNVKIETGAPTNEQISTAVDAFFGKTPPAAVSVDVDEEGTIILTGGEYYENGNEVAY